MNYMYQIKNIAIEQADKILPVPNNYPLKSGIDDELRTGFSHFFALAKTIYYDISENPECYGFTPTDSINSLQQQMSILYVLARSGKIEDKKIVINISLFKDSIKKAKAKKYNLIFDNLTKLGIKFDGYTGQNFKKDQNSFSVSFPSNPQIIKALKIYADCCTACVEEHQKEIYGAPFYNPYKLFCNFDYKYTADFSKLLQITWVHDHVYFWNENDKNFFMAFYEQAIKNPKIRYDVKFYKGSKLIADICHSNRSRQNIFGLRLYLPPKGNGDRFNQLPQHIIEYMKNHKCSDCDSFAGLKASNGGKCTNTVEWVHEGEELKCCAYHCFDFINPKIEDIPVYCSLQK